MSEPKLKNIQDPLKIAGGILVLAVSVGLMIHRLPKRGYVQAHADKPRAAASNANSASATSQSLPKIEKSQLISQAAPKSAESDQVDASEEPPIDWRDACESELGILCNDIAPRHWRKCLRGYDDSLRKTCRESLK